MSGIPATISVASLKETLAKPSLVVLDVTWYSNKDARQDYLKCHLPGARYLDVMEAEHTELYPRNIPTEEAFQAAMRKVGVNNDSEVVLYEGTGQGGYFIGSRARWVFKLFGFNNVSVLDGGLQKWLEAGYPTESGEVAAQEGNFTAKYDSSIRTTYDAMLANLSTPGNVQVLDSRPADKFASGHYPGAINMPFASSLLDINSGKLKSQEELKQVFESAGVNLNKPIVTYCNSGMSSTSLFLAAQVCGSHNASVFHGGFTEWNTKSPDKVEK